MGTLSKLRRLVLREGVSVREAAQRLGIARNTASRWLALVDVTEPRYPKRVPAKSILEPYKEQMILWLKADMHRGKRDRRTTKEIYEGIRELGVETGNQSWRFRSSTAKVKGAKTSRAKLLKGDEETAVSQDLSTIL